MIDDSLPWRSELMRLADRLEKRARQKRWTSRTAFENERDLMVGMFSIRRLIESEKSSSRLPEKAVPVVVCKLLGREPMPLDSWRPDRYYDLGSRQRSELPLKHLLHEFIHSFILTMIDANAEGSGGGVLVASDRTKKRHVFMVSTIHVVELFRYVGTEDVAAFRGSMRGGTYESERVSNHDVEEGEVPEWYLDDMEGALRHALRHLAEARRSDTPSSP